MDAICVSIVRIKDVIFGVYQLRGFTIAVEVNYYTINIDYDDLNYLMQFIHDGAFRVLNINGYTFKLMFPTPKTVYFVVFKGEDLVFDFEVERITLHIFFELLRNLKR